MMYAGKCFEDWSENMESSYLSQSHTCIEQEKHTCWACGSDEANFVKEENAYFCEECEKRLHEV